MADNKDILTPGQYGEEGCDQTNPIVDTSQYLEKDNYLGEFESEAEKEIARVNLGVPDVDSVYQKIESDNQAKKFIQEAMQLHLNTDDPHGILPQVNDKLKGIVKDDGTTPFKAPQAGIDPISDYHLVTKRFVTSLLRSHLEDNDPHHIMELVNEALTEYVKASQVYFKDEVYTKAELSKMLNDYLKNDGTTPFKRPQLGIDPKTDGHLTTKRYVDNLIQEHLVEIDPHGFLTTLNKRLALYYKKTETYSKAETYSRIQLDSIINALVRDAAKNIMDEHIYASDPHGTLQAVKNEHYVKRDGSIPFTQPQKGQEAIEDDEFVTLGQIKALIGDPDDPDNPGIIGGGCEGWKTSGPVQTTVGFVEDNTQLPEKLTCQEIFDLIFYGKGIDVNSPEYWPIGESCPVEMIIHGAVADIQLIELYQNGELIGTYTPEQFESGSYTDTSLPLNVDTTTFTFKVCYMNGTCLEATSVTKIGYYSFVGLLPKWYSGSNLNYEYLQQLAADDPLNNENILFTDLTLTKRYQFSSPGDPKHLFIMIPKSDNKTLYQLVTPSQQFGIDAFDVISDLPIVYPGGSTKVYTVYIYREALTGLNIEVTFKFDKN